MCLYRPPNARVSSWDYIDNLFDKCVDSGISNCVFLGDINVDLITIEFKAQLKFRYQVRPLWFISVIATMVGLLDIHM